MTEKVQRALAAAKKDNDFIYHDIVPEVANLNPIGSAAIAKPLEIPKPMYPKFSGGYYMFLLFIIFIFVLLLNSFNVNTTLTVLL